MEAFAPLPVDLFSNDGGLNEEDPSTYFSLSQFDMELQQQAQAALLEQDSWQDFDKYLPIDNQIFSNNTQAQPIFMGNTMNSTFNTDATLLYEPLSDLLPQQQQQQQQQQQKNFFDNMNNPTIVSSSVGSNTMPNVKNEYASPESLPYSPPQNIQSTLSLSPPKPDEQPVLFQTSPLTEKKLSPNPSNSVTTSIDFLNWNTSSQGQANKVPIQRLKSNTIINNAVNAALNQTAQNPPAVRQHKKTAHNAIERRYRNNINDRIAELKNAVPALLYAKVNKTAGSKRRNEDDDDEGEDGEEFLDGVAVATKLNKATILRKATEYINHLKKTGQDIKRENQALQNILTQLPGGADILQRYHIQKQQREREIHQQMMMERELQKQQDQQRKAANRKRARHNDDEYESSSSSPDPITPPAMTNRVFMAIFMCITFFSTSPLTAGPNSSGQYTDHHHTSRATTMGEQQQQQAPENSFTNTNASPESFLGSMFKFDDAWSALRTTVFIICIVQLFFPYIKTMFFGSSLKLKRVNKAKRLVVSRRDSGAAAYTPGDLKCKQIYTILDKSLGHDEDEVPQGLAIVFPFCKEAARIFSHHVLGYDIMYSENEDATPEEEWGRVCKWVKLNETACLGGADGVSRLSLLYSCFRMINLVDILDDRVHDGVSQTHARAYATAAMQMLLLIPNRSMAEKLSHYFWEHAVAHKEEEEDAGLWLESLSWSDADPYENDVHDMSGTRAWLETMEILRAGQQQQRKSGFMIGLSYSAPVVVPVSILSTLHLLEKLKIQFDRLVNMMTTPNADDITETSFIDILLLTEQSANESEDDQQRLVHWLAAVGATVEALWKNQDAEKWATTLVQRVPRPVTCRASSVNQKSNLYQLDELTKKAMIHTLVGSICLKSENSERQKQGLTELENDEVLRSAIRKLQKNRTTEDQENSIEANTMALAEFVVAYVGLGSSIDAMKLEGLSSEKEVLIDEQIRETSLSLRRMIRHPLLSENQQSIVDRLSRLGRFITQHPGESDSACDLSDTEDEDQDCETDLSHHQVMVKRSDKAQLILRGLA